MLGMFGDYDKIRILLKESLLASLFGLMVTGLILVISAYLNSGSIDIPAVQDLYGHHNMFYLLNLLPVAFGIAGGFRSVSNGRKISRYRQTVERQASNIQNIVSFAREIGNGNLEARFIPANEEELENALENMRTGLISANRMENERNEIIRIVGEVGSILSTYNEIGRISDEIIAYLAGKLEGVVQGAFYIVKDVDDSQPVIEMTASYAYSRQKRLQAKFAFGEGLVGQAAIEKVLIHRTEIPDDYLSVTSGLLGEQKPTSLIITPLITNDTVYGLIELASFDRFTSLQTMIMEEVSEIIARAIFNLRVNEQTYRLLEESREMGKELERQKIQLMENAEKTVATQEELRKSNLKLEEQIQEVYRGNKKTRILLENASEVITIFSEEGNVLYVSPSIKNILGYFPEEITGQDDHENVHPQDTAAFREFLEKLVSFPENTQTIQYRYFTKSGDIIWLEATGKNLLTDPVISGIVVNSRDISVQRLAAREQRMRAKMQALSENSQDIIVRIDVFSRCIYINPVIESFTGLTPEMFLKKPLSDIGVDGRIIEFWKDMLNTVAGEKKKRKDEMIFPTPEGDRIMQVDTIPEFNENGDIESVLIVSHDITEAKRREEIISLKNKSIEDSINYAYYIQSALMPTETELQKYLPNSFMIYLPKDVVSGDYPWLFRNGDNIYVGAMDCTGHGVPGALMSIIGYFLQNQVMQQYDDLDAGQFLDRLHQVVVKSLKQEDPDSKTNDGMDAAFCKINLKKKVLQFAGAHRPLYHVHKGNLTEWKGDKCPVGSTQYKGRKPFTNNTIDIQSGDAVYFMTDGFADQYGGPEGGEKYMAGRVKILIRENTHLSIFQMGELFRKTFTDWKGGNKQMDDILITGIKF